MIRLTIEISNGIRAVNLDAKGSTIEEALVYAHTLRKISGEAHEAVEEMIRMDK